VDKALIIKAAVPAFLLPSVAQAGPVIPVAAAIGGAIGLTGAAAIAVGAVAIAAVGYVAVKAIGSALTGAFAPDIPGYDVGAPDQSAAIEGVKVTRKGTNEPVPVVYGHRRIGGKIVFAESHGDTDDVNNRYLTVVYALCEGEIAQVNRIFVDEVQLPNENPSFSTGSNNQQSPGSGRYKNRLAFQLYAGTETQTQSSLADGAPSWNDKTRTMPGIAYAVMRYEWKHIEDNDDAENNPYGGGIPNVMFDIIGKKVYDVATHVGNTEDLANDYADLSKGISYNPVNHLLDYLMNPRFGPGITKEEIDAKYFFVAANKCNQVIDYDSNGTQDGPAMLSNVVIDTRAKIIDNVKILVQGCRGFMPYSRGRYKVRIDDGGNRYDIESSNVDVELDITEDELLYGMSLSGENKADKYNQVIVKFVDPDKNFTEQQVVFPAETSSTYTTALAEDNGEQLVGEFLYASVSNKNIAENLARTIFNKSRNQRYIQFTGSPKLMELEVGDIIRVTSTVFNLTEQTFRVTKLTINPQATVSVEAREHDASIYPFVAGEQIENPPKVFASDFFSIVPQPLPNPEHPVAVRPPQLQNPVIGPIVSPKSDFNFNVPYYSPIVASNLAIALTANNTLPQAPDSSAITTVTSFNEFGASSGTTALLNGVVGNTFPINSSITEVPGGGVLNFSIQTPKDSTLDALRIYSYSVATGAINKRTDLTYNTEAGQTGVISFSIDFNDDTYFVPRFLNTASGKEYKDGSAGPHVALTYTNLNNESDSAKTLEAAMNNAIQAVDLTTDPDTRETTHQLG